MLKEGWLKESLHRATEESHKTPDWARNIFLAREREYGAGAMREIGFSAGTGEPKPRSDEQTSK